MDVSGTFRADPALVQNYLYIYIDTVTFTHPVYIYNNIFGTLDMNQYIHLYLSFKDFQKKWIVK